MGARRARDRARELSGRASLRRWALRALAVGLALGAAGGAHYLSVREKLGRPMPSADLRFEGARKRLEAPPIVSPNEEYPGAEGETLYLTADQFRAASMLRTLPLAGFDNRLAGALAEREPDRQAERLIAIFDSIPDTAAGDETAVAIDRIAEGVLSAPPSTPTRARALTHVQDAMACRFRSGSGGLGWRVKECPSRPSILPTYFLAGAGGAMLLVAATVAFFARRARA